MQNLIAGRLNLHGFFKPYILTNKQSNPFEGLYEEYFSMNKILFFIMLCIITFLILYLKKSFIESNIAAFEILEERGELGIWHIFTTLQYFSIPVVYLYKFTVTAFILWIGCFLFGYKVIYSKLWGLTMLAEIIFFIPEILKTLWFILVQSDPNIWDVRAFYPLSLMHFFDYEMLNNAWHYPLKALNLFEVAYWFFLVYGVCFLSGKKLKTSYIIVFSSYVFWFLAWLGYYVIIYK